MILLIHFIVARNISKYYKQNFPNPKVMSSDSQKPHICCQKWQLKAENNLILEAEISNSFTFSHEKLLKQIINYHKVANIFLPIKYSICLLNFSCVYKTIAKNFCVYLTSFNLRLWTSHVSMTNFIMWNTLYCSLWTVLNSCSCVLNVGLLTSGRLWAPPVF